MKSQKKDTKDEKPILLITKEEVKKQLDDRINSGKKIKEINIHSESDLDNSERSYNKWTEYNFELLKSIFTNDIIAKEYLYASGSTSIAPDPIWGNPLPTLHTNYINTITAKLDKLESIIDRTELFQITKDNNKAELNNFGALYIANERIDILRKLTHPEFDLLKLIKLLEELNSASKEMNVFTIAMLLRSIIDHIPPIFNFKTFSEVANNYTWSKSNRELMLRLDNSLRNIADSYLHTKIRKKEIIPSPTQVDFRPEMDVLLSELITLLE